MVFKIRTLSLPIPRTQEDLYIIHGSPLKRFTWRELKVATNNFSGKNIVGRGGFGNVYRGLLPDGSVVAVKRLLGNHINGGELQFQAEVKIGGCQASDHRNVLRLRGYCITRKERLLVYPFMNNRSVASRIRDRQTSEPPLDWATRKRIALGVAKGLAHIHSGSSFQVLHRDLKAANILLDDQFEAVLSDFGLAKFVDRNSNEELPNSGWVQRPMEEENEDPFKEEESEDEDRYGFTVSCWNFTKTLMIKSDNVDEAREGTKRSCWQVTKNEVISISSGDRSAGTVGPPNIHDSRGGSEAQAQPNYDFTHVTTAVRGTIGHIAPEYLSDGKCSVKSDAFGYGIMLLELITGQRICDLARLANDDDVMVLDWVEGLMRGNKLDVVVDSGLGTDYVIEEIEQLTQISLLCAKISPMDRPLMSEVVKMIENIGQRPSHDQLLGRENVVKRFSLHQLKLATDNFNKKNIMGRSGFSNVYRGRLQEDGSIVVVKRVVSKSKRGRQQFRAEVKLGSMITEGHPNLLQLRGYYSSGKDMLLVYPFMAHRSLEWSLRPERSLRLGWRVRMRIALGTAKGIAYLHNDCDLNTIIRRDVKPSNILLDDDFNPVLSNLRLESNDSSQVDNNEDSNPDLTDIEGSNQNGYQVSSAICLVKNDVYAFGTTLFVLVSGKKVADLNVMAANDHDNSYTNGSNVHNWFKNKLMHHQLRLLVVPVIVLGDSNYDTIKDEIEQIVQVALLCTQPSPMDRPEMSEVIQMLEGISQGDLKVCFAFDHANLFLFNSNPLECPQAELQPEVELGDMLDLPSLDTEGSVCAELGHINQVQLKSTDEVMPKSEPHLNMPSISKQDTSFTSKGKEIVSSSVKPACNKPHDDKQTRDRSQSKGISISDNKWEPKMHERWKVFLSEVVSGALPTKSKLCQSGMSVDPLCPFCNEYEEDNFHLFFNCDFSKQAWQLVMGVRIDMLGFESVKEAVDVILMPDARVNIPSGLEPSHFSDKGVAVMYSIWNHRNKVCFEKVPPNVKEVVSLSQNH